MQDQPRGGYWGVMGDYLDEIMHMIFNRYKLLFSITLFKWRVVFLFLNLFFILKNVLDKSD